MRSTRCSPASGCRASTKGSCATGSATARASCCARRWLRAGARPRSCPTAHRLRDYLDLVICGDTLAAKKPDPLPVAHCLHRFNAAPERTLLVGDSEIDVATARAAGIRVWAVPHGYNRGRPIAAAGADRIIDSIAAVVRSLEDERAAA